MTVSARERAALDFISEHVRLTGGVAPSVRQIAAHLGARVSTSAVQALLNGLARRGIIRRMPRHHRAIEIVRRPAVFRFDDTAKALVRVRPP